MQRSTTSAIVFRVPENVIFVVKYAAIVTLVGTTFRLYFFNSIRSSSIK